MLLLALACLIIVGPLRGFFAPFPALLFELENEESLAGPYADIRSVKTAEERTWGS